MKRVNLTLTILVLIGLVMSVLPSVQVKAAGAWQRSFSEWLTAQGTLVLPTVDGFPAELVRVFQAGN